MFKIHFISGLPRSGSTLLSALLRQNPRFVASITSHVAALFGAMHQKMCGGDFGIHFDDVRRGAMLRGVFNAYYAEAPEDGVVFDTNRIWTARAAVLGALYPESRLICCVRDVAWVIDSIERMLSKNPLQLARIFGFKPGNSVYSRVETLMNSETGLVGLPWHAFREAWFGEHAKRLIIVPYDTLVSEPQRTLRRLYDEIGEEAFQHDFENVVFDTPEFDAEVGMPGLHKVKPRVERSDRQPSIPPDIFAKYATANFWKNPEMNHRGVKIL